MNKQYYVYIMANFARTVLYTGNTNNLIRRVGEHKNNVSDGFTKRYSIHNLVYYEILESALTSIERDKQIKKMGRKKKETMILKFNPTLKDLYEDIV